jgi:hypothetical protein
MRAVGTEYVRVHTGVLPISIGKKRMRRLLVAMLLFSFSWELRWGRLRAFCGR